MIETMRQTADFLTSKIAEPPKIGMITGTGLGSITEQMTVDFRLPHDKIPNFPQSTVEGHKGMLVAGKLAGKPVIALEGHFHIYEGYFFQGRPLRSLKVDTMQYRPLLKRIPITF